MVGQSLACGNQLVPQLRPLPLLLALVLACLASAWLNLNTGSAHIAVLEALHQANTLDHQILLELRLPRMSTAFVTGALLGIAGALMQVLLRNPLADPYILGVSGGASVAALLAITAGASGMILSGSAFAGALLSTLLVFTLAHGRGNWDSTRLLLTGVVLAAGWGAVISLLLAISPSTQLHGMLFWLMGDLGFSRMPLAGSLVLLLLLLIALAISPSLNLLARGELQAASLGVAVGRLRTAIYVLASLATASAVTQAGNIGFVGLIAPHMLRLLGARDHRLLIPGVALLGGTLLLLADAISRLIIEPRQLPVGVLTALLGVPLFLLLLFRTRQLNNE
jgi:iron complex transport system permease protein